MRTFYRMAFAIIGVIASAQVLSQSLPETESGCLVLRNEVTGVISARAVDEKTGEVLESVLIQADGVPVIMRSRTGKGALHKKCDITILNVLGRADQRRIMRAASS